MQAHYLKQSLIYLLLTILVIIFAKQVQFLFQVINHLLQQTDNFLIPIFNKNLSGFIIRKIIILISLPLGIAGIINLSYRILFGKTLPYFIEIVWIIWLILFMTILLSHH